MTQPWTQLSCDLSLRVNVKRKSLQPAAALPSALSADLSPVGDEDSAIEPASSVEHEIDDPGGGADDNGWCGGWTLECTPTPGP